MKNGFLKFMQAVTAIAIVFIFIGISPKSVNADNGYEGATRIEIGRSGSTAVVTGSSTTGTGFSAATVKRPDGMYFNNTSSIVWIGTTTTSIQAAHSNITMGFPIASSATFKLGGSYTGSWNFTCDAGVATCEIRKLEGVVP